MSVKQDNKMREIQVKKVVLNIGCGKDGNIEHAREILNTITGRKPKITITKKRTTFGVAKRKPIGVCVTLRKGAEDLLKRLFEAMDNHLIIRNFDNQGNLSFGIAEYISIPDMEYDPNKKIFGLDVCVTLERPGFSIRKKSIGRKVGKKHLISKEDSMEFMKKKFGIEILEERRKEY